MNPASFPNPHSAPHPLPAQHTGHAQLTSIRTLIAAALTFTILTSCSHSSRSEKNSPQSSIFTLDLPPHYVVAIQVDHPTKGPKRGGGLLVGRNGDILTCAHVVAPYWGDLQTSYRIFWQGRWRTGVVAERMDKRSDLALLRVGEIAHLFRKNKTPFAPIIAPTPPASTPAAALPTSSPATNTPILAILPEPTPLLPDIHALTPHTATRRLHTIHGRILNEASQLPGLPRTIRVDMPIELGDSGFPVFDNEKKLVGIIHSRPSGTTTTLAYLIHNSEIQHFLGL